MSEKENITLEQLFQRAYFFITEGRIENALATLEGISAERPEQKREIAYLRAWCHMLRERWDIAAQFILSAEVIDDPISDISTLGQTERRRRSYYILVLGNVAANLGRYEEAARHYIQCIKFLDERRMNDVRLRIKALCGLGMTHTVTGYFANALDYYAEALRLCGANTLDSNLPDIYYGLCDAHRHLGNLDQALKYGKEALQLYIERSDRKRTCRMRNILGRVYYQMGDFASASSSYTEALALAMSVESPGMVLNNFTALADLRLVEEKPGEARRFCELALDYCKNVSQNHFVGMMYIVCGKVAEAQAKQASGRKASDFTAEAISFYKQAVDVLSSTEARVELADAYGRLAQVLEDSGQQGQALDYWRSAYSARSGPEESPLV